MASASVQPCWLGWASRLHQTSSPNPSAHVGRVLARWISLVAPFFFSRIRRIGTGDPMFGALPGHAQPAQGHPNRFVADQSRCEPLGETHLGGQLQRPAAGGLAEGPGTLVQQRPQGLAGARVEDRGVVWGRDDCGCNAASPRWWNAWSALRTVCSVQRRSWAIVVVDLALGTGEQDLAAAHGKGGRRPETGLQSCPLVRQERAYI